MDRREAILTGVPRSGTSLSCELLNRLPQTVALDEPMDSVPLAGGVRGRRPADAPEGPPDRARILAYVERFLADARESILTRGAAPSWQVEGKIFGSRVADDPGSGGVRTMQASRGEISVDKPLERDFLLIVKHPAAFTALLEGLVERYPVFAVVRNPLAVLASWQTMPFTIRDGHHLTAEQIEPELGRALAAIDDRIGRQLHLLGWFYDKYRRLLPDDRVLRYERIVETGGSCLAPITPRAEALTEPLASRNQAQVYDQEGMKELGERLLESEGAYWSYYARESVQALLRG